MAGAWLCLLAAGFPLLLQPQLLEAHLGAFPWETPDSPKLGSTLEML